jgi:hypothetical protein
MNSEIGSLDRVDDDARAFDFWVGEWDVEANGSVGAHNSIGLIHDGRVVHERYSTDDGRFSGSSLSCFDAATGSWRQCWMDSAGQVLDLAGGWIDGAMVMTGRTHDGQVQRVRWTPNADGTVRQHWTRSSDAGVTWVDVFDGTYRRR